MHVNVRPNHLSRKVDPGQRFAYERQLVGAFRCRAAVRIPREIDLGAQLPVGRALVARASMDGPIANEQLTDAGAEPQSCGRKERDADLGTSLPQRVATFDRRSAASRDALIRA